MIDPAETTDQYGPRPDLPRISAGWHNDFQRCGPPENRPESVASRLGLRGPAAETTDTPVMAAHAWPTNAHMIEDVARLGYLRKEWRTLDPTYGRGNFWTRWRPDALVTSDILTGVDFRHLPHDDGAFQAVVFDPPYKLNGTPSNPDIRYGVGEKATRKERMDLIFDGLDECWRVLRHGGMLLVKCQDQVCGGKVRWQTDDITQQLAFLGMEKTDRLDFLTTPRPQPARTRADGEVSGQHHARRNYSTLLVFRSTRKVPTSYVR